MNLKQKLADNGVSSQTRLTQKFSQTQDQEHLPFQDDPILPKNLKIHQSEN